MNEDDYLLSSVETEDHLMNFERMKMVAVLATHFQHIRNALEQFERG